MPAATLTEPCARCGRLHDTDDLATYVDPMGIRDRLCRPCIDALDVD